MRCRHASSSYLAGATLLLSLVAGERHAAADTPASASPATDTPASASPASAAATAPADEGARIESSTCSHPLLEDVEHLVRVELNGAVLPGARVAPRVILTCAGRVNLIRVMIGDETDSRQLDLDQTDEGLRARVIALATAELVRDTASRAARPKPAPRAEVPPASPPPPIVQDRPASHNRLFVFGKVGSFGSSLQPAWGAGTGFEHDLGHVALGLGPELLTAQRDFGLGSVRVLAGDLSLRLAWRFASHVLPSELGLGHALGLARISGRATSAGAISDSVSGVWAGPFLFAGCEPPLGQSAFLHIAAQLGVVTVPVRGQIAHEEDMAVAGLWAGLSLGVGLGL